MNNNHAYLRLPKILVKKEEVGFLLSKYDKIESQKNDCKLKDNSVIRIIPYIYINFNDFSTLLGSCLSYKELKIPLLTGLQSAKSNNCISYKILKKLSDLEKELNLNLSISKDLRNKISQINFVKK